MSAAPYAERCDDPAMLSSLIVAGLAMTAPPGAAAAVPTRPAAPVVIGRSVEGRRIVARRIGDPEAPRKVLVVGAIHGEEPAGTAVIAALRRGTAPAGTELWLVRTVNPDGLRVGRRTNAHGVDLNRNFAHGWRPIARGRGDHSGSRPFSEPESRAVRALVRRLRPRVTIWFHQPWGQVLAPCRGPAPLHARYARIARLELKRCRGADLPGTATRWQSATVPGSTAFVVELGPARLSRGAAARHARAVRAVAG